MNAGRRLLRIVSMLLQYPDAALREQLPEIGASIASLANADLREKLGGILSFMRESPLLDLQTTYTAAFDLDPQAGLYMTYPLFEKEVERSQALVGLYRFYRDEGYEPCSGEIPDFLPLILEFLSVCSPQAFDALVDLFRKPVRDLAAHLKESEHPYAGLLESVADLLNGKAEGGS
jgi:nitrate reductase molybdenum cofactor assembly chaperone NarJ/NarW